jgi:chaperonin cofactor prefoldin
LMAEVRWRLSRGNDPPATAGVIFMMIDLKPKLIAALGNAQEYLDLAISAKDRGERELYERLAELYLKIAQELEALVEG